MTLTIGRLTYDEGRVVGAPAAGGVVNLSAVLPALDDPVELLNWRNLANNPDEPVVPFTSTDRPDLDGYYRVTAANVETAGPANDGLATVAATLVPVVDWQNPRHEVIVDGALMANDHSVTAGTDVPWVAIPSSAVELEIDNASAATTRDCGIVPVDSTRDTTADASDAGGVEVYELNDYADRPNYRLAAADAYEGACGVWVDTTDDTADGSGDGTWRPIVGRWFDASTNAPYALLVGNGILRLRSASTASAASRAFWNVEHYDGSEWVDLGLIDLSLTSPTSTIYPQTVRVVHNSPNLVKVRVGFGEQSTTAAVTITLRRGAAYANFTAKAASTVYWHSNYASGGYTTLTAGRRRTSNYGGNFVRQVIASPGSFTTATFILELTADTEHRLGYGVEIGGSTATGYNAAQSVIYQYLAGQTERLFIGGV